MLRKDTLVTLRHPITLALVLLIPALLFLTICDDRFSPPPMKGYYPAQNNTLFDLNRRSIAYYPSDEPEIIKWISGIHKLYGRNLSSIELLPFKSEAELKEFVLHKCIDCLWAAFTFSTNNDSHNELDYRYGWRT